MREPTLVQSENNRLSNVARAHILSQGITRYIGRHHAGIDVTAVLAACMEVGMFAVADTKLDLPKYLREVADTIEGKKDEGEGGKDG